MQTNQGIEYHKNKTIKAKTSFYVSINNRNTLVSNIHYQLSQGETTIKIPQTNRTNL